MNEGNTPPPPHNSTAWMPATPDPTALSREAMALLREEMYRAVSGLRELIEARLGKLESSIETFHAGFPVEVKSQVAAASELLVEKLTTLRLETSQRFDSIKLQFAERDMRTDRASEASKTAVEAAFLANQKAADANAEYAEKSIGKSEAATKEKIDGLQALLTGALNDIRGQISAITSRLDRGEALIKGSSDHRSEQRASAGMVVAIAAAAATAVSMLVGGVMFAATHLTPAPTPAIAQSGYAPPTIVAPAVVPVQPAK